MGRRDIEILVLVGERASQLFAFGVGADRAAGIWD